MPALDAASPMIPDQNRREQAMTMITVKMMRLPHAQDLPAPDQYAHAGWLDLVAAIPANAPITLAPGQRTAIPTGLAIALPPGTEAQIRPRSGLALRDGVTVLSAPQTIDASYRGELHVILINLGEEPFTLERGARIALLVVAQVLAMKSEWVNRMAVE
jgi:dUTP pyrophosphatase